MFGSGLFKGAVEGRRECATVEERDDGRGIGRNVGEEMDGCVWARQVGKKLSSSHALCILY